jgi:hypothetical protein
MDWELRVSLTVYAIGMLLSSASSIYPEKNVTVNLSEPTGGNYGKL